MTIQEKIIQAKAHMDLAVELLQEVSAIAADKNNRSEMMTQNKNYISFSAAARRLGVHPSTITRMVQVGQLKSYTIAGVKRIKAIDVEARRVRHDLTA